jgi:malate dehydrogenase (oxaloacetate-decarboxylating)
MAPKVPARDKESLSLVYTPGVAEACTVIKNKPEEVYNLTNKANSILIITDGSESASGDGKNYQYLPALEVRATFYKQLFNIDAYPLLLNRDLTKTPEEFFEVLYNLTPGFAGFELFHVEKSREEKILALDQSQPLKTLLIPSSVRAQIDEAVGNQDIVKTNTLAGALVRAALDNRAFTAIPGDVIKTYAQSVLKHKEVLAKENYYEIALQAVEEAAKALSGLATLKEVTPEESRNKLDQFLVEGPHSWLHHSKFDYLDEKHNYKDNAVELHRVHIGVTNLKPKLDFKDISFFRHLFGKENSQEVSNFILEDVKKRPYQVTMKNNMCAIITNGTAILGLGDIGPEAGMPVMEGKSVLFKQLAGVDVIPMSIREKNPEKAVSIIERFGHTFAAINLEDIKAPECFKIEGGLQERLDIPVFHDDQHGTAVVTLAALLNALKVIKKKPEDVKLVMNGGGAAGLAITELLLEGGIKNIVICDTKGAIYEGRPENMNEEKNKLAKITNRNQEKGKLEDIVKGADVFVGVSVGGVLKKEMVKSMKENPVIIALANPEPEILPEEAQEAGAAVIATGRSDFPNQVNNSLVFPGIFRGAIDIRASKITTGMKMAAVHAICGLIKEEELKADFIIPGALDFKVPLGVASAVVETGMKEGVALREIDMKLYKENFKYFTLHGEFNSTKKTGKGQEEKI